jgi:hypothetical protein
VPPCLIQIFIESFEVRNCLTINSLELSAPRSFVENILSDRTLLDYDWFTAQLVGQVAYNHAHYLLLRLHGMSVDATPSRFFLNHLITTVEEFGDVSPDVLL